jgi:proline iminopeptidase
MMMLTPGHHMAAVNGLQLGYTVMGKGPVLFVVSPGWGIGSTYLQRGMAPLSKDFTVVCIDTRGSGSSTRPADETDMGSAAMADDIDQLRQHLGLESIDLMGHSNGGAIAISYAERYAARCRKLFLIDSQLIGFSGGEMTGKFLANGAEDPRYREAVPYAGLSLPDTDEAFTERLQNLMPLYFYEPQKSLPLFLETMDGLVAAQAFHAQAAVDRLPAADQTESRQNIKADTLIIVGRHDWICPVMVSERLHAGISGSRLVVFEKTGHMPWVEEPGRFFPEVARFLRG